VSPKSLGEFEKPIHSPRIIRRDDRDGLTIGVENAESLGSDALVSVYVRPDAMEGREVRIVRGDQYGGITSGLRQVAMLALLPETAQGFFERFRTDPKTNGIGPIMDRDFLSTSRVCHHFEARGTRAELSSS
jgi:hypothetical protein